MSSALRNCFVPLCKDCQSYNNSTHSAGNSLIFYTQAEVPDRNQICPDRSRRKVPMSRPSQTQSAYVQTVPDGKWICPDFRAFQIFRAFFVRSKTNMSRPSQTETVYVQTFVRSCPDHRALQLKFVRSTPNFSCVHVQTIVRSCPDHRAFKSRPSCVHVQTFVRSPDRKKITSWGAVLFLEDEDREGSKIPQIHMFKVYQKT